MHYDIIGLGYNSVDYIGVVSAYPPIDEKARMEEFDIQGGGVTSTAMVAAARLGAKTAYVGVVGDDDFGGFSLRELQSSGVDISRVIVRKGERTAFAFIVVDKPTGLRNIFWSDSALTDFRADELDKEFILSAKVLHIDNHQPEAAAQAAEWANDAGITTLMDAGSVQPGVIDLLERVDVLIASSKFAKELVGTNDLERAACDMFVGRRRASIVTDGRAGCWCATQEGRFHVPAFEVDAVDTTGAGDVYHGAFSFGLSRGWDIQKTAVFASAVAAMKCTQLGGRRGVPSLDEAIRFLGERDSSWRL